jgi:hypothetical protein
MKTIQKTIILSLGIGIFGTIVTPAVFANPFGVSQIQQVNSGLFRSNSQDFFEEGREKMEREIKLLIQESLSVNKEILKIDDQLRSNAITSLGANRKDAEDAKVRGREKQR